MVDWLQAQSGLAEAPTRANENGAPDPAPDSLAIIVKQHGRERRIPLRVWGSPDPLKIGPDKTVFKLEGGDKRRLRARGLPKNDQMTPTRFLFRWRGGERLRIDGSGAEGLPPRCRVRVHLYSEAGVPLLRKSVKISLDPWFDLDLPDEPGRGTVSVTLYGKGVYRPLTFDIRVLKARKTRPILTPETMLAADALREAGDQAWRDRDYLETVRCYEQVAETFVVSDTVSRRMRTSLLKLADQFFREGQFEHAERYYRRCSAMGESDRRGTLRWAEALRSLELSSQADRVLFDVFGDAPGDVDVWRALIKNAETAGDAQLVLRRWSDAIACTASQPLRLAFIAMLERRGDGQGVVEQLRLAVAADPGSVTLRYRLVVTLRRSGRWSECLAQIDTLLPDAPADLVAALSSLAADCRTDLFDHGDVSQNQSDGVTVASLQPEARSERAALKKWLSYLEIGLDDQALSQIAALARQGCTARIRSAAAWQLSQWHMAHPAPQSSQAAWDWLEVQKNTGVDIAASVWVGVELLVRLGRLQAAEDLWLSARGSNAGANLALAAANLAHHQGRANDERLRRLNAIFVDHSLPALSCAATAPLSIDTIECSAPMQEDGPLVSIVMPLYNGEDVLATALQSLQRQSWRNIEVIIVDDASTDGGPAIAHAFAASDPRFRVVANDENRGAYHSRNAGARLAGGEFVTCHDADDWSHPLKIERQVRHLIEDSDAIGNMSRCITATTDLHFVPRTRIANAFRWNFSSLMFRRSPVLDAVGAEFWDEVRFGADGELVARLRRIFGLYSIRKLTAGPLSIVRQSTGSLTGHVSTGINARGMSLRNLYQQRFSLWHETDGSGFALRSSTGRRSFPVPHSLRHRRSGESRYDVILASDFRLTGGTTASNVQEIMAQRGAGLRTGLIQMYSPRLNASTPLSPKILNLIDDELVELVTVDQEAVADLAVVRWPPCLVERNVALPALKARHAVIVANQTPFRDAERSEQLYDPVACGQRVANLFGAEPTWWPIGPMAREGVEPWRDRIALSPSDWVNVLDLGQWRRKAEGRTSTAPVIGRHGRDFPGKWPMRAEELLAAYPDAPDIQVEILGGAKVAEDLIGYRPANWVVHPFDGLSVQNYLERLDVFVYFPDESLNEAFGRTILEAMAVGVPVVLPFRFQEVFGPAAIYCSAEAVREVVGHLMDQPDVYGEQVRRGYTFVGKHTAARHLERVSHYLKPANQADVHRAMGFADSGDRRNV